MDPFLGPDTSQPTDTQPAISNLPSTQSSIQAMRKAGNSDEQIISRLLKSKAVDDNVKTILAEASLDGKHSKAVSDLLALDSGLGPLITKESLQSDYNAAAPAAVKAGTAVFGGEKLGRRLSAFALEHGLAPGSASYRENMDKAVSTSTITPEERQLAATGGVSGKEALADTAVVGANLALPAVGDKLGLSILSKEAAPTAGATERILNPILRSSAVQGGLSAAGDLANGGDTSSAVKAGAAGAVVGAALPIAGRVLSGLANKAEEFPDKAYTSVFGTNKKEVTTAAKALADGRETPETAALWAKRKGFAGDPEDMAGQIAKFRADAGHQLSSLAKNQEGEIALTDRKFYTSVVKAITEGHDSQLNPEAATEGRDILKFLKVNKKGELDANQALRLRQFIDEARVKSSFNVNPALSEKQDAFKRAADTLRSQIAKNWPQLADQLHDYSQATNAFGQIVKVAAKKGNANILSHYDALAGAAAALGHPGVAIPADIALRLSRDPAAVTKTAQVMSKGIDAVDAARSTVIRAPRSLNVASFGAIPENSSLGTVNQNVRQLGRAATRNAVRLLTSGAASSQ